MPRSLVTWVVLALLVVALLGGTTLVIGKVEDLARSCVTDDARCEAVRRVVVRAVLAQFGSNATPAIARACVAIVAAEAPAAWDGRAPIVGDATLPGGPSVGPMQVYRATAKDLGLWEPPSDAATEQDERDAYALVSSDLARCVRWGVAVFAEKLRLAKGSVPDAIRRYNGTGPAARAYQVRVLGFAAGEWGGLDSGERTV